MTDVVCDEDWCPWHREGKCSADTLFTTSDGLTRGLHCPYDERPQGIRPDQTDAYEAWKKAWKEG